MVRVNQFVPGIWRILLNQKIACYLINSRYTALIDTGNPVDAPELISGLKQIGLSPADLDMLLLTHIHADHAGCAGALSLENPQLKILVHAKGIRHLSDPSRLNTSIKKIYGDQFNGVGAFLPVADPDRIQAVATGDQINLGRTVMQVLETPGHASHHLVFFDEIEGRVFSGDALGSRYTGFPNFPLTPPPDYDPALSLQSIDSICALHPKQICYTHDGPWTLTDPISYFDRLKNKHRLWVKTVSEIRKMNTDPPPLKTVQKLFLELRPELKRFPNQHSSFNLSVAGISNFLDRVQ